METEHDSRYPEECSDIVNVNGVVTSEQGPLYRFVDYLGHFFSHWHG